MGRQSTQIGWSASVLAGAVLLGGAISPARGASPSPAGVATASASAPASTQPLAWPDLLDHVAGAISTRDIGGLRALLDPLPMMRAFGSDSAQPPERLLAAAMNGKVLSVHGYVGVPKTLASDLAGDLKSAPEKSIPQEAMDALLPRDASAAKTANSVAADWISQVLQPSAQQLVGVIIVWPARSHDPSDRSETGPIFVLILGDLAPRSGRCVIERIQFGDPLEATR